MKEKLDALLGKEVVLRQHRWTVTGPLQKDYHGDYVVDGKYRTSYFPVSVVEDVSGNVITQKGYQDD